ncbi:MAG: hypothetical protein LBQ51_05175 [Desulfovibrio sp.]|jgi:hypothetical protein|nr:hypothetical protein [Desulfovibrio sp.]
MANEGFLGKTTISGERAATDDHPAVIHALPLDASVLAPLPVGTILRRVEITDGEDEPTVLAYAYKPFAATDTVLPCAVVDKPCDPTGTSAETSAICLVHGTVKTRLLKVGEAPATEEVIGKLAQSGIFAV